MALRQAILGFEGTAPGATEWILTARSGATTLSSVTFRTLATREAQALEARLRAIGMAELLPRAVARAFELAESGLVNEAAQEHDHLVAAMPASETVLAAAIAAHERIGNAERVRELTAMLNRTR